MANSSHGQRSTAFQMPFVTSSSEANREKCFDGGAEALRSWTAAAASSPSPSPSLSPSYSCSSKAFSSTMRSKSFAACRSSFFSENTSWVADSSNNNQSNRKLSPSSPLDQTMTILPDGAPHHGEDQRIILSASLGSPQSFVSLSQAMGATSIRGTSMRDTPIRDTLMGDNPRKRDTFMEGTSMRGAPVHELVAPTPSTSLWGFGASSKLEHQVSTPHMDKLGASPLPSSKTYDSRSLSIPSRSSSFYSNSASPDEVVHDVEMRALEGKLELIKIQRQLSAIKCQQFLKTLEDMSSSQSSRRQSYDDHSSRKKPRVHRGKSSQRRRSHSSAFPLSPGAFSPSSCICPVDMHPSPHSTTQRSPWTASEPMVHRSSTVAGGFGSTGNAFPNGSRSSLRSPAASGPALYATSWSVGEGSKKEGHEVSSAPRLPS